MINRTGPTANPPEAAEPPISPGSPEAALVATVRASAEDAAELASELALAVTESGRSAAIADRLSEELAEAAAMLRALPGHPAKMPGHDAQLLAALRTVYRRGEDVAETLARALGRLAGELGLSHAVNASQPGSWQAEHVAELLRGTLGPGDENPSLYGSAE